ncbi:MAG: recombinase family protein, partial [Nocardioidaceae bacterium]
MARRAAKIDTNGKPWARYLRLSKLEAAELRGKTKDERLALTQAKLDAHLREVTEWMDTHGVSYCDEHIYRDPGLSAWKPGVRRPDWEQMMQRAESGELAGIGIVAVDRFTRDVSTMEDLIRLAETTDVKIGGPRAGTLDLTTYDGIMRAR